MQKSIATLVGVNLALAGYLGFALSHSGTGQKRASTPAAVESVSTNEVAAAILKPVTASKAATASEKAAWASLASPNLSRYAENLRKAGCPEQTIKDIMLAEVNRQYTSQESALKVRPDDVPPWEQSASYDRRGGETKLRKLLEEKRSLLKALTGVDVGIDMPSRLAGRDVEKFEGAYGAIPDTKRDQVRAIQENYFAQSDEIKQRTVGYLEPEDRDEFLRIKTERKDAMAKILSPRELQDYEMQTSDTAPALRTRMEGFQLSDEEFRKVFDFMQPLQDQYSLGRRNPDPVNEEFTAARTKAEKDLQDYIHSTVGDERFAEYQRTRDPAYRTISQIGTEAGLPQDSIVQAYQAQQQMQAESQRILQDTSLSQEQRDQSLNAMRAQAQQKMQQLFGDKAAQILQQIPGARSSLNVTPVQIIQKTP